MNEHPRIALAPEVLAGKPVIRGTRLSVEFVIGLMADGWSEADILENYPGITHDDILACLAYARDTLGISSVPSAKNDARAVLEFVDHPKGSIMPRPVFSKSTRFRVTTVRPWT